MSRARAFKQRDVTAAIKAAFAAGAVRARVEVGGMIVTADKATFQESSDSLDHELAAFEARHGQA